MTWIWETIIERGLDRRLQRLSGRRARARATPKPVEVWEGPHGERLTCSPGSVVRCRMEQSGYKLVDVERAGGDA